MSPLPAFIHLRTHSAYSLSRGAIPVKGLVKLCVEHGMPAVALTDSGNLFGSLEFSLAALDVGVQPIIGCVVNLREASESPWEQKSPPPAPMVLLAKDDTGYHHLLKLVSQSYLQGIYQGVPTLTLDTFKGASEGLIAFTGGAEGVLGQHLLARQPERAMEVLEVLKSYFPERLYIELMRHGREVEVQTEPALLEMAYAHGLPLVATNDVHFATPGMAEAHRVLTCIAEGSYISEGAHPYFTPEHYFKSAEEMQALFSDIPEAIANTVQIAQRCAVMSHPRKPMLPGFATGEGRDEAAELRVQAEAGLKERLEEAAYTEDMNAATREEIAKPYFERLQFELDTIVNMQFPGYFLIVSDFIRWSKQHGIPVGPGRGSGAGSVVAWSLQITDLDPLRFGLLFERFLNPERISMPDFDIDFCQERRDEVIQYVRDKYGADKVAQIITFGKLQARAVLRDVGRVLQMPYKKVDGICKMIPFNPLAPVTLSQAIEMDKELQAERERDETVAHLLDIGLKLEGLYRHASTHAAGVVIADRPLDELIPLYSDPRSDMPVTQYSMKYAEMAGLVKFDFLGLKTLTLIDRACKLVRERVPEFDIRAIPLDDKPSYKLLSEGRTVGVFQMESAGMRDALRKMRPDTIEDIIALISLYRPGPMENIPTYIACKHGREKPDYLHPKLEPILKETFGVMIYQEQVMQIAQVLSGYSLGGADLLRRAMGKKIKEEMDAQRESFMQGAKKNHVDPKKAGEIFDLVAKFAGYGFNKSHSAAYGFIAFQTAYLKA
ncbi:MAG: DNA polymerase III subunit alpha, partial [Rickettsiales bacterium]|nr:DNA polymerase III subunit alpha [Rickettsiales bacterium]